MKKRIILSASFIAFVFIVGALSSCKPRVTEGQETITTLKLKLTPNGSSVQKVFSYKNLNGITTKDTIVLSAGSSYIATLEILDETKSPADDITLEIAEEKNEHQFFFVASPASLVTFSNFDKDSNGKDVGLISTFTTTSVGKGTLQVVLKHLGEDPKTSNITSGETDMDVVFDVVVQ